jgi:hypothetical protein
MCTIEQSESKSVVAPLSSEGTDEHIHFIVRVHQAHMTYQDLLAIWKTADRLGYDGASLFDLLAAPCLECWTTLTMLTMATWSAPIITDQVRRKCSAHMAELRDEWKARPLHHHWFRMAEVLLR